MLALPPLPGASQWRCGHAATGVLSKWSEAVPSEVRAGGSFWLPAWEDGTPTQSRPAPRSPPRQLSLPEAPPRPRSGSSSGVGCGRRRQHRSVSASVSAPSCDHGTAGYSTGVSVHGTYSKYSATWRRPSSDERPTVRRRRWGFTGVRLRVCGESAWPWGMEETTSDTPGAHLTGSKAPSSSSLNPLQCFRRSVTSRMSVSLP